MARQVAQNFDSPTSGASNAEDFQPLTQNPQDVSGNLFPESGNVQPGAFESLLQNRDARIIVPSNPAPAPSEVAQAKGPGPMLIIGLTIIIAAVLLYIANRLPDAKRRFSAKPIVRPGTLATPIAPEPPAQEPEPTPVAATPAQTPKPKAAKKTAPKKSKSKRKNRGRR